MLLKAPAQETQPQGTVEEEAKAEGVCRSPQRTRKHLSTPVKPGQPEVRAPAVQWAGQSPKRTVSCNPNRSPGPAGTVVQWAQTQPRIAKPVNELPRFGKLHPSSSQACLQSRVSWRVFKTHGASGPWPQFRSHQSGVLENSPGIPQGQWGAVGREALEGCGSCRPVRGSVSWRGWGPRGSEEGGTGWFWGSGAAGRP